MISKRHEGGFQKHGDWLSKAWRLDGKDMEIGWEKHRD